MPKGSMCSGWTPAHNEEEVRLFWEGRDEDVHAADWSGKPLQEDQSGAPEWWAREMVTTARAERALWALALIGRDGLAPAKKIWPEVPEEEILRMARALADSCRRQAHWGRTRLNSRWLPGPLQPEDPPVTPCYRISEGTLALLRFWDDGLEAREGFHAAYRAALRRALEYLTRYYSEETAWVRRALDAAEGRQPVPRASFTYQQTVAIRRGLCSAIASLPWEAQQELARRMGVRDAYLAASKAEGPDLLYWAQYIEKVKAETGQ